VARERPRRLIQTLLPYDNGSEITNPARDGGSLKRIGVIARFASREEKSQSHLLNGGRGRVFPRSRIRGFSLGDGKLFQISLTTIFPNPSLSTYAHGVFGSWVNTVNHFPGTDCA
jgi:hypothetical protein